MEYKQALSFVIGVEKKVMTVKIRCPMKLRKVNVIIVTQYFETLNQFPDTVSKIQWFSLRNRVLNVSESTTIHLKLLDRLNLTLILNPS